MILQLRSRRRQGYVGQAGLYKDITMNYFRIIVLLTGIVITDAQAMHRLAKVAAARHSFAFLSTRVRLLNTSSSNASNFGKSTKNFNGYFNAEDLVPGQTVVCNKPLFVALCVNASKEQKLDQTNLQRLLHQYKNKQIETHGAKNEDLYLPHQGACNLLSYIPWNGSKVFHKSLDWLTALTLCEKENRPPRPSDFSTFRCPVLLNNQETELAFAPFQFPLLHDDDFCKILHKGENRWLFCYKVCNGDVKVTYMFCYNHSLDKKTSAEFDDLLAKIKE